MITSSHAVLLLLLVLFLKESVLRILLLFLMRMIFSFCRQIMTEIVQLWSLFKQVTVIKKFFSASICLLSFFARELDLLGCFQIQLTSVVLPILYSHLERSDYFYILTYATGQPSFLISTSILRTFLRGCNRTVWPAISIQKQFLEENFNSTNFE